MITSIEPQLNANGRYTVKETSALLGIDRHTLSRYVKAGYIRPIFKRKPIQMNKPRIRFLGSEITRFWRAFV
jgi:predicted site-specific integrase-resolvase